MPVRCQAAGEGNAGDAPTEQRDPQLSAGLAPLGIILRLQMAGCLGSRNSATQLIVYTLLMRRACG